jgi:hypothetical protein
MDLKSLLQEKKASIVKKWRDVVLSTYPEQSQKFLRKQKDAIANPVGRRIIEGIESLYDEVVDEADSRKISLFLDELAKEILQNGISEEWAAFEIRLDGLALLCFDVYSECRQKLFDIRVNEVRNQSHRLLKMAGLAYDLPEDYESPGGGGELKEEEVKNG